MRLTIRFYAVLALATGALGVGHAQDANNLLTDGYFLNASGNTDSDWGFVGPSGDTFTATYASNSAAGGDPNGYGNFLTFTTPDGYSNNSGPEFATSDFKSAPGQDLTITFDAKVSDGTALIGVMQGSNLDGVSVDDPVGPPWVSETFTTTGGATSFVIENVGSGPLTVQIANVDIVDTPSGSPEPFTLGIGIAGICLAVRRRSLQKIAKHFA